jgi:hypothetical protein
MEVLPLGMVVLLLAGMGVKTKHFDVDALIGNVVRDEYW